MTTRVTHHSGSADPSVTYRLQVAGHLDDHWSDWLGGHTLVRNDDASTTLTVEVVDQAQLHGVLAGIRDMGVSLLSLTILHRSARDVAADAHHHGPGAPSDR
jgi:hypothetical protein